MLHNMTATGTCASMQAKISTHYCKEQLMRIFSILLLILAGFFSQYAMAAESKIEISSPAEGAKLDAMEQNKMTYNVTLGPGGDHIHVYIDGSEVGLLREMKGTYTLENMAPGGHEICIKIVNKNHTPIGVDRCVKVKVE